MFQNFFKSLINLFKFINIENKKKEFVFYSESKYYRDYYIDLIENLKKLNKDNIIIITSDEKDELFFKDKLNCLFIKNYFILSIFFKILNCKFMIMTLTDLGNHFRTSKFCKFYVYYFHAIGSTHQIYTNSAFKNYNIIFSNGEYQSKELRFSEKQFNFPKKDIVNTGYFFLDNIKKKANQKLKENRNLLFAPSWNYNVKNLFDDYSLDIISDLLSNNFKLTLRPHPEHYKRSKNLINKINKMFLSNKNFYMDQNISNLNSLEKAEILITDNSSIVFEFLLTFKRPVIYLDYTDKIHNVDKDKIQIPTIEEEFKNLFGNKLKIFELKSLPNLCEKLIIKNNLSNELIENFEKKYLSNLGNSAYFAANYLLKKSK